MPGNRVVAFACHNYQAAIGRLSLHGESDRNAARLRSPAVVRASRPRAIDFLGKAYRTGQPVRRSDDLIVEREKRY